MVSGDAGDSSPIDESSPKGSHRRPRSAVLRLGLLIGLFAAAGAAAFGLVRFLDLGDHVTFVSCAAFDGEPQDCTTGIVIEKVSAHGSLVGGEDCRDTIDWEPGGDSFSLGGGCAGVFRVTAGSGDQPLPDPRPDPFESEPFPVTIDCEPVDGDTVRCDTGGHLPALASGVSDACVGNLRVLPDQRFVEARAGCEPEVTTVLVGGVRTLECSSPVGEHRRCEASVLEAEEISVVELGERCGDEDDSDRRWGIVNTERAEVEVYDGCSARFDVAYVGDLGPPRTDQPFEAATVDCVTDGAAVATCSPIVGGAVRAAVGVDGGPGCEPDAWRSDIDGLTVDGCSGMILIFHEPPTVFARTVACESAVAPDEPGPAPYVVCEPGVTGIQSISLQPGASGCDADGPRPRWRVEDSVIRVFGGCVAEFRIVYEGSEIGEPTARAVFQAVEVACGGEASICATNVDGSLVDVVPVSRDDAGSGSGSEDGDGDGDGADRCGPDDWTLVGTAIEVAGCADRFTVYFDGAIVDVGGVTELRMPYGRGQAWRTYTGPGHGTIEHDLEPLDQGSPAHVLAVADGTARYVCSTPGRHATIELDTEIGTFRYLHLDEPDIGRRFGAPGASRQLVQGDVIGMLSPVMGVGPDFVVQDGSCFSRSGSVHLHLEMPTESTWIDGYSFSLGVCELDPAEGGCELPPSTNRTIGDVGDGPRSDRSPAPFEGTVLRLVGVDLERSTFWVEGGRLLLIASFADFADCLDVAASPPVRVRNSLPAENGWDIDLTPGIDRCPGNNTGEGLNG